MQSAREKAEQYVRGMFPRLMVLSFGCEIYNFDEPIDWARTQKIVHYDTQKSVLVARENDGSTYRKSTTLEGYKIIGHPIQLQHWLHALALEIQDVAMGRHHATFQTYGSGPTITFDLITGQPLTEADYQSFNEIVCSTQ